MKRKVGDENRQFQEKWETEYVFVELRGISTCQNAQIKLWCTKTITLDVITQLDMLRCMCVSTAVYCTNEYKCTTNCGGFSVDKSDSTGVVVGSSAFFYYFDCGPVLC